MIFSHHVKGAFGNLPYVKIPDDIISGNSIVRVMAGSLWYTSDASFWQKLRNAQMLFFLHRSISLACDHNGFCYDATSLIPLKNLLARPASNPESPWTRISPRQI